MENSNEDTQEPNGEGQNETDEELREKVIEEMDLDPEEHEEIVDKMVEREKQYRENLGTAIRQKKNWREKAKSKSQKDQSGQGDSPSNTNQGNTPDVESLVEQKLEERELESMDLPDEVKKEVKEMAQFKGISVREASKLDYIQQRKEEVERKKRAEKATPSRNNKGKPTSNFDPSKPLRKEDFDFDTEEGVKAWKEAKAARKRWKQQNK